MAFPTHEGCFKSGREGGSASGMFHVQVPLGTPTPRRLSNFSLPKCPGRIYLLPHCCWFLVLFLNNFVCCHHDLHSPAGLCELGNNKSLNHTTVLLLTVWALLRSAGVRMRRPCSQLKSRPKIDPPFPTCLFSLPLRLSGGPGAVKALSTLPSTT